MKIAFQGENFSNSEEAAGCFADKLQIRQAEFLPLVNSGPVIEAVLCGRADLGVCAVENSAGGPVKETKEAENRAGGRIRVVDRVKLPIHHCLFIRSEMDKNIHYIVSHVQALRQTKKFVESHYPGAGLLEAKDTALAARMLAEGGYAPDCGVICKKEAGEHYGLYLLAENIEDDKENKTEFALYALNGTDLFTADNRI